MKQIIYLSGLILIATKVIVTPDWADFVFDKNYTLMPLPEVEAFINKNKHLPDVPSATEVKTNGVSLGEMNAVYYKR